MKKLNKDPIMHKLKRNMKIFNLELFLEDLNQNIKKFDVSEKNCLNLPIVHKLCEKFVSMFVNVVNRHAPLQKMTRKEQRFNDKPWLSIALKKLINIKNEMFHSIIMKNSDNEQRCIEYKKYRNCLQKVTENKNNPGKLWMTIKELVNINNNKETPVIHLRNDENQLISDSQQACGILNEFFLTLDLKWRAQFQI